MRRKRRSGRLRGWWERPSSSDDRQDAARAWCDERAGGDDLRRAGRLRADGRQRQWRAPRDPDVLVHRRARPECRRRRSARRDLRGRGGRGGHAPARAARGMAWRAPFRVRARHPRRCAERSRGRRAGREQPRGAPPRRGAARGGVAAAEPARQPTVVLVGRYDLNTEFYRLQSGALFINSSFGIGPEFAHSGVAGPSIFPNTAVGTRVAFKPSPNVVWRAAVLDGEPVDRPGDGTRVFAAGDGALLVGEVALLPRPDTVGAPRQRRFGIGRGRTRPYGGKLAIGAWYYTARFSDLVDTLPNGASVQHRGSGGVYLIGDLTVRSLTAFAQLGLGDGRVNQIGGYVGGGFTLTAPFSSRAQDALGLAVAAARNGSHYERAQTAGGPAAG